MSQSPDDEDIFLSPPSSAQQPSETSWTSALGWSVYFPNFPESDPLSSARSQTVAALTRTLVSPSGRSLLSSIPRGSFIIPLIYPSLIHTSSPASFRSLAQALVRNPDDALASIGLAACRAVEALANTSHPVLNDWRSLPVCVPNRLWPRVYGFAPLSRMRALRGESVGRFVAVKGTVVRVSAIRQHVRAMVFQCAKCGEKDARRMDGYRYNAPHGCSRKGCRGKIMNPLRDMADTVDWQKLRLQEIVERDSTAAEEGRMPRTVDAEVLDDLIDTCIPGDVVTVCGIVRVLTIENGGYSRSSKCLYYMYIDANSTTNTRNRHMAAVASNSSIGRELVESETVAIHRVIREVVRENDPFGFLVHSAVPSIYGHEMVKAGLLLSLFGGASKKRIGTATTSDTVSVRTDIHCLVVGDPGLGKSQMLKALRNIAPRGVYVCGNTSSTAGLTVTVVREASGDFALEAGALVLGDRGLCCIDEFDKMGAEHAALLEAMEQQSVSVAKAGLLCNLSARTTVVAAANPVGGHYDRSRTVCENLKIALPLLSRFDLVFILTDKADEARDKFISEHVMKTFGMRASSRQLGQEWRQNGSSRDDENAVQMPSLLSRSFNRDDNAETLQRRLRKLKVSDPLPARLFRQYVAYAKAHVQPELSEEAKRELQEFYLDLRKRAAEQSIDTTPITTRQLESLIRLSEARARAVMRTVVTAEDARDVIEIMRESMIETLTDETGAVDLGRASGMSKSTDARRFINALGCEAKRRRSAEFDRRTLKGIAESIGIIGERFDRTVESVNYQGVLIKKRKTWILQGSEFSDNAS